MPGVKCPRCGCTCTTLVTPKVGWCNKDQSTFSLQTTETAEAELKLKEPVGSK